MCDKTITQTIIIDEDTKNREVTIKTIAWPSSPTIDVNNARFVNLLMANDNHIKTIDLICKLYFEAEMVIRFNKSDTEANQAETGQQIIINVLSIYCNNKGTDNETQTTKDIKEKVSILEENLTIFLTAPDKDTYLAIVFKTADCEGKSLGNNIEQVINAYAAITKKRPAQSTEAL